VSHGVKTIAVVPGTEREERSLHHQLRRWRGNGEWFSCHPKVVEVMVRSLMFCRVMLDENASGTNSERSDAPCDHIAPAMHGNPP